MNLFIYVALLAFGYWFYTDQIIFFLLIILFHILVRGILSVFLRPSRSSVLFIFDIFYVIYGALVLLTQIELIHNPFKDFYVHNDAAWSFYKWISCYIIPYEWSELLERSIFLPNFSHYPLAAFIMGFWGKLGCDIGIVDLRLFLRILIFITGALIPTLMANILSENNFDNKKIYTFIIPFGIFTHLYMSSAIFSRDIFVCFSYTLGAYVFLKEKVKFRLIYFIFLAFISAGFRPENGLLFMIYPFAFYYSALKYKFGNLRYVMWVIISVCLLTLLQDSITSGMSALNHYEELNTSQNSSQGMFMKLYQLPFPINTIIMVIYMFLQPLPMFIYIFSEGCTWFNLPLIFSPYLMCICLVVCIFSIKRFSLDRVNLLIWVSLFCFALIVFGSPDLRRAFAAIPGLYLCYCLKYESCPQSIINYAKLVGWSLIGIINVFFVYYVYFR